MAKTEVASVAQMYPVVLENNGATYNNSKRPDLLDRIADASADSLTSATRFAGQLYEAFDTVHFNDGVQRQKLRNQLKRKEYWDAFAAEHGLTPQELAALIAR